jgi:hypothetical protein
MKVTVAIEDDSGVLCRSVSAQADLLFLARMNAAYARIILEKMCKEMADALAKEVFPNDGSKIEIRPGYMCFRGYESGSLYIK